MRGLVCIAADIEDNPERRMKPFPRAGACTSPSSNSITIDDYYYLLLPFITVPIAILMQEGSHTLTHAGQKFSGIIRQGDCLSV